MGFKYLEKAEFDALTPDQQKAYAENKRKHEQDEANKNAKQIVDKAIAEANKELEDKLKTAEDKLKTISEEVTTLKENNGGMSKGKKGELSEFFEKNAKEMRDYEANKSVPSTSQKNFVIKAPALMTTANVKPIAGGQFNQLFNNYIDTEIGHTPKPDNFILNLVNVTTQPNTEKIWWVERVNEEGDAEFVNEGDLAPLIDGEYQENSDDIYEVTESWKFSRRLQTHAPSVENDFRQHANELIEQKIDDKVLLGDNAVTSTEPNGITTKAGAFVAPTALANYYTEANIYDAINACATRVRLSNFKGQITCVLNTVWEAKMKGIKDKNDNYILPHFVTPDGRNVGTVNVVFQNKMPEADILIGDLMKFNVVIGDDVSYTEGWENDDFRKRLVSRMLDAQLGTYIKGTDAGSIIFNPIADVLTQIELVIP